MYYDADLIKKKVRVSTIVGRTVNLKSRGGNTYLGLCPFHKEKTASFFVNDDKGIYHCFGCGIHGDLFSYVMESEGLEYKHALAQLADLTGTAPETHSHLIDDAQCKQKLLYNLYERVSVYYSKQLFSLAGKKALDYLRSRGISDFTVKRYELGYSPKDSTAFIKYLKETFEEKDLIKAGVLNKKHSQLYDPFYGRLIFPIKDSTSRVIAFGGRVLDTKQQPKYLNSAESTIFNKSQILYGFDLARKYIHKKKSVLIVEGYMDVLSLANQDITYVVAPLGTAIKKEQIQPLWELCTEPAICFDNDEAGNKASEKIAYEVLPYIKENRSLQFITLQEGKDPDDVIVQNGIDELQRQLDRGISLADFIFKIESRKVELRSPERKVLLKNNLEKVILVIRDMQIQKSYHYYFTEKYFQLLKAQRKTEKGAIDDKELKKYFKNTEEDLDSHLLIPCILKSPHSLRDNIIFEGFIEIELPSNLDFIRKAMLDCTSTESLINLDSVKSLLTREGCERSYEFFSTISADLNWTIPCVKRILKVKRIQKLRKEIITLQDRLLGSDAADLMQRILYLKKSEQEIERELAD